MLDGLVRSPHDRHISEERNEAVAVSVGGGDGYDWTTSVRAPSGDVERSRPLSRVATATNARDIHQRNFVRSCRTAVRRRNPASQPPTAASSGKRGPIGPSRTTPASQSTGDVQCCRATRSGSVGVPPGCDRPDGKRGHLTPITDGLCREPRGRGDGSGPSIDATLSNKVMSVTERRTGRTSTERACPGRRTGPEPFRSWDGRRRIIAAEPRGSAGGPVQGAAALTERPCENTAGTWV